MNLFAGPKSARIAGALLLAWASFFTGSLLAQTTGAGTIAGTITDPSSGAVPGASVAIRNTATGLERSLVTNEAGIYVAQFLKPGKYQITVSKQGFTKILRKDLSLQVGQILSVDLQMSIQTNTDTVQSKARATSSTAKRPKCRKSFLKRRRRIYRSPDAAGKASPC